MYDVRWNLVIISVGYRVKSIVGTRFRQWATERLAEYHNKKRASQCDALFLWLGYPDSNQERQDQNLQCYHYTIAQ